MIRCDLCWNTKDIKQFLNEGQYCPEHFANMERYHLEETKRRIEDKKYLISKCVVEGIEHNDDDILNCFRCINRYCSEFYLCESCYKEKKGLEVKGSTRYDSLVLCDEHNNNFRPIVKKLYAALGVN